MRVYGKPIHPSIHLEELEVKEELEDTILKEQMRTKNGQTAHSLGLSAQILSNLAMLQIFPLPSSDQESKGGVRWLARL